MIIGTLEQSFILAIMVIGVYISYKILDFPDMTVDGSFPLGGSVTALLLVKGVNLILAILVAMILGAIAGAITGYINVKLKVTNLLAGIIVMTGLYSINLRIMGKSNIPLFTTKNIFHGNISPVVVSIIFLLVVKVIVDFLLNTKFGFALKALGDNESLVVSLGLDEKVWKIYGLMISNSLVALSGGLLAQYQGFADVEMGTGTIITGLASIIIGEAILGKNKLLKGTWMVIIGTIIYKAIISIALWIGMNASDLKLITSILVVIIIYLKLKKESLRKKGGVVNA
ncbi:ABC transporter permease [uncultured Fusobacterium sp.]|jgi:putative ABC transport system permease protein|uniref:ABC transporter permease n=1 Tax=uncultured Fusobacterium sp. TaxID=159267 RepID=UPI00258A53ED|nr:ABC transporter permease [uncultured Fusobacterium sp.]